MALALIATSPYAVIAILGDNATTLHLPNGNVVDGVSVGWAGGGYALVSVAPFVAPAGQQIVPGSAVSYAIDATGKVSETYPTQPIPPPPPPPVPATVSAMQAKVALERAGLLTQVQTWINTQSAETQLIWNSADSFSRGSTLVNAAAAALGLTSAQVDQLFITAAGINP